MKIKKGEVSKFINELNKLSNKYKIGIVSEDPVYLERIEIKEKIYYKTSETIWSNTYELDCPNDFGPCDGCVKSVSR